MDNEKLNSGDEFFMGQAILEAKIALGKGEVPIGAIVVTKNRVVARAHNMVQTLSDPTAHAEMQAITAACATVGGKYLPDSTLYVTVEPCPMCAAAAAWAQIGKIVYGAADDKRGYSSVSDRLLHPKTEVVSGVLGEQCAELVTDFFAKKR